MTTIGNYLARLPVSWLNVRETLQAFEAWKAAHPGAELDNIHTKSVARWDANGKEVGAVNVAFYPHTMRVRLFYTIFDRRTGEREETEKWFCIASRPSNLGEGRGRRYYFVCPVTGRLAQKLYIVEGEAVTLHELRERGGVSYWYQNKSHWERGCRWHDLKTGDVVILHNTGAYCMTEGISLFLSRDLPAVVWLKENGEAQLLRDAQSVWGLNGGVRA